MRAHGQQEVADRRHGDHAGPQQGAVEVPAGEEQAQAAGDGGLDHHGAGDVGQRQLGLALAHPDHRVHDLRQLGGDRGEQQRGDRGGESEHRADGVQLVDEELRGEEDHHQGDPGSGRRPPRSPGTRPWAGTSAAPTRRPRRPPRGRRGSRARSRPRTPRRRPGRAPA
ncbi:hypothetical protein GZL_02667 [Streptomyces sp. 769]|nr:hypothetical protein GZL_02667 [Streptomyces sp. 769]